MPVTITLPDAIVDAITERRGSEALVDQLCDLIDHGYHYAHIHYPADSPYDWADDNDHHPRAAHSSANQYERSTTKWDN